MNTSRIIQKAHSRYKEIIFAVVYIVAAFILSFLVYKCDYENNLYRSSTVEFSQNGVDYTSDKFAIPECNLVTSVTYSSLTDSQVAVMMNGAYLGLASAPATGEGNYSVVSVSHQVPWSSSDYSISFLGVNEGDVTVSMVEFIADRPLNNDSKARAIVCFICLSLLLIFIINLHSGRISLGAACQMGVMAALVVFVSSPLMSDYCLAGHDLWGLSGRIEGIKDAWQCGQIFPVVMPYAFNGFGYLEFMYPELFLLIPASLRFCNVSMATSLHIYEFIINILTVVIAYFSVKSVLLALKDNKGSKETHEFALEVETVNKKIAIISMLSAVFYLLTQYRLADLYIRAAIGEAVSMTFLPLAIAGLFHILAGNRRRWWMAAIGMSGILHSHILSCAIVVPVVVIFALCYIRNIFIDKRFKEIIYCIITFFVINAWDIIPFVKFYLFGLNTDALIVNDVENHTVLLRQLFSTTAGFEGSDYFLRTIGLASLAALIIVVIYYIERISGKVIYTKSSPMEDSLKLMLVISLVFSIFLIGSLDIIPWQWIERKSSVAGSLASMLQFPFRLLTVSSACIVFMLAIGLFETKILETYLNPIVIGIMILSLYGSGVLMDNYMSNYHSMTELTGGFEDHVPEDYLPKGIDTSIFADTGAYINDGSVDMIKNGTDVSLNYTSDADTVATIPLLYYPCYKAVDENDNEITLFQSPDKRIGLYLPAGQHSVSIKVKLY